VTVPWSVDNGHVVGEPSPGGSNSRGARLCHVAGAQGPVGHMQGADNIPHGVSE
jgi:hypothetical protein